MSYDPQWNQFQPPHMNSSSADMLNYKSQGPQHNSPLEYNGTYGSNNGPSVYARPSYASGRTQSNNMSGSNNGGSSGRFPIGTFSTTESMQYNGDNMMMMSNNSSRQSNHTSSSANSSYDSASQSVRETGIIEKLLHSYGFIQCCERQARLFFHFSQFNGNIEHLKIGDPVEFEMTYDRRTGKPIASAVTKIAPEVVLSEERVTGIVTTELPQPDSQGRISYENRGECFFLPYCKEDVEGNVTLRAGDKVSFQIATNQRSGNLAARNVRLENPAHPVRYQGVVCSMKESFGFIERADVVKEIFFHFSEAKTMKEDLQLGDDVEFTIQTRNGKEVACNITRLEPGSVVFEDVGTDVIKGQVLKPLERGLARHQNDPLPGRLHYRAPDHSEVEIPFGDKDQQGDFTLRHGDWVQFCIATDRRDSLHRATNIKLLEESFEMSGEKREQGVVAALKEGFGFLRCVDRDSRMFFHFNELLDVDRELRLGDEVEFTVAQDPSQPGRQSATRIAVLPPGSVQFELIVQRDVTGIVSKEAPPPSCWQPRSPTKGAGEKQCGGESGLITYTANGQKKSIFYFFKDCNDPKTVPRVGDKVEFNLCQVKRNKELLAVDVQVVQRAPPPCSVQSPSARNGSATLTPLGVVGQQCQGYVAALKDGFGFIEASTHDREVFFHFSNYDGEQSLELGMEVEFTLASRNTPNGSCMSAENVKILPKGTIPAPAVDPTVHTGVVTRPLRSVNPDQVEYAGLVRESIAAEEADIEGETVETPPTFEFGIVGLANKRDLLQAGDPVTFQIDAEGRATNIVAVRKKKRAIVDAVKGQFGFLAYEVEEGKKLFFHTSEVADGVNLQPGDSVEFVLVTNQRTGKSSACSILRVGECKRPERLISKLRSISLDDSGPRIIVIRQPKGPDGTKGFVEPRVSRLPGQLSPATSPAAVPIGEEEDDNSSIVEVVDIPPPAELMSPVAASEN